MSLALYFDHNMQRAVVQGLRARGIDSLTAMEDGFDRQTDDAVLERATELLRVLVTHDQDYLALAKTWQAMSRPFCGVVFCDLSGAKIETMIDEIELVASSLDEHEINNAVIWIPF